MVHCKGLRVGMCYFSMFAINRKSEKLSSHGNFQLGHDLIKLRLKQTFVYDRLKYNSEACKENKEYLDLARYRKSAPATHKIRVS